MRLGNHISSKCGIYIIDNLSFLKLKYGILSFCENDIDDDETEAEAVGAQRLVLPSQTGAFKDDPLAQYLNSLEQRVNPVSSAEKCIYIYIIIRK